MSQLVKKFKDFNRMVRKELAYRILRYREHQDVTQEEFAKLADVSRIFVAEIETNYNMKRLIRISTVEKIEAVLERVENAYISND